MVKREHITGPAVPGIADGLISSASVRGIGDRLLIGTVIGGPARS
jgi:hypothetical protein